MRLHISEETSLNDEAVILEEVRRWDKQGLKTIADVEELKDILREASLSIHTYFLFVLKLQEEETYHGQDLETAEARALLEILDMQY